MRSIDDHIGKIPPQSVDIEKAILGSLLLEKDAYLEISNVLNPETFYDPKHQNIYSAIRQLFTDSSPIDILTTTNQLKKDGLLEASGGAIYISKLTSNVASASNIEFHAKVVNEKFMLRELIRTGAELQKSSYNDDGDVFDIIAEVESSIMNLTTTTIQNKMQNAKELVHEFLVEQTSEINNNSGIPTNYTDLDLLMGGCVDSDFILLAARPSMGKSALMLNLVRRMSHDQNKAVAVFSLEMSKSQLMLRYFSDITTIPIWKMRDRKTTVDEWRAVMKTADDIKKKNLFIDDTAGIRLNDLRSKCIRLKMQNKLDCVVIDYLQLMKLHFKVQSREQEISQISSGLKALAKELNVPVIALSQLSREVEKRPDKRPKLSDLRESGSLEQDADVVLFLMRPEYYGISTWNYGDDNHDTKGLAQVEVAKNRNGSVGPILLKFEKNLAKFSNYEKPNAEELL